MELAQLRQVLLAEKRQRLLVEEQTQMLAEQHTKVVGTLEQRIRKQEKQLQMVMDALNAQHGYDGGVDGASKGTPRSRILRQRTAASARLSEVEATATPRSGHEPSPAEPQEGAIRIPSVCSESFSKGSTAVPHGDVDDVALFLQNISKELESINDLEIERHSKLLML
jgi:hypothetical protein